MPKKPMLIMLNGAPETGKSTVVTRSLAYSLRALGGTVYLDSLAAPLKHFISVTLGVKYSDLKKDIPIDVLQGYSPREFIISLAEDHIRERYGRDFFARVLLYRVLRCNPLPDFVVVDDLGFVEELDAIRGYNTRVVRVTRPGKDYSSDSRSDVPNPHHVLVNDGSLEDIYSKCNTLANTLFHELNADGYIGTPPL